MEDKRFELVGREPESRVLSEWEGDRSGEKDRSRSGFWKRINRIKIRKKKSKRQVLSLCLLLIMMAGCFGCELFIPKDPLYMDLANYAHKPDREFWFGTDTMGRDLFSMIWYGGRISLLIGFAATAISTLIAVIFGTVSGLAPRWLDGLVMRLTEILLSVPSLQIGRAHV